MLHVRVTAPRDLAESTVERVADEAAVANLVVVRDVVQGDDGGDLLMFDLARENANDVLDDLRSLGIEDRGSIDVQEAETVLSRAADEAERAAPGKPADAVVWQTVQEHADGDARLSWSFVTFMTLATLIASVGRYVDQPILIIGAMVVGPEFAPTSAICFALARRRWGRIPPALLTLGVAAGVAGALTFALWVVASLAGAVDPQQATTGRLTDFVVTPDVWSLVVALLAGSAGVLSLTSAKSSTLVGVFISVTTVPALGAAALSLAVGDLGEAASSLLQLGVNLLGIVVAGTLTLVVQQRFWRPSYRADRRL